MTQNDHHWLLAKAMIEAKLDGTLYYYQQAIEIAPFSDIAVYSLARFLDYKLRTKNEINNQKTVARIINNYNEVLRINPGIISALVDQGYLNWLIGDLKEAKEKFKRGLQYKEIVSETFTADLNYGLAKIAAEEDDFSKSLELYTRDYFY